MPGPLAVPIYYGLAHIGRAIVQGLASQALPAATAGAVVGGGYVASNMIQANQAAQEEQARTRERASAVTCATCRDNPCATEAAGVPGSKYRGGAHGATRYPTNDGMHSHHTPAKDASFLHENVGPAIQMDPMDHGDTASYGSGRFAKDYRATQSELINSGRFMEAVMMDVADIKSLFGNKYDEAIAQMLRYAECLKRNGIVQ